MAERMERLAAKQPGFLGMETVRGEDGFGITVSYWRNSEVIVQWKQHTEQVVARRFGNQSFYEAYSVRVARVERACERPSRAPADERGLRSDCRWCGKRSKIARSETRSRHPLTTMPP